MSFSPNKNYNLQATGANVNTWGVVLNSALSLIDNNLGGTLTLSVAGSSNVNISVSQSQYLIYNFTGALTGNINVIFPAQGGLYFINNRTTGNYTLTIKSGSSTANVLVPQGQSMPIAVDASTSPPTVDGFIATPSSYIANTVAGSADAVLVSSTTPSNFSLVVGGLLTYTPTIVNTNTVTMETPDGNIATIQKIGWGGLTNLVAGDTPVGLPNLLLWNGTVWIALNIPPVPYEMTVSTNQAIAFAENTFSYINTSAVTYTIDQTTNLAAFWYMDINAKGGAATITPHAGDVINVNGRALSASASYVIPQGASCRLITDGAGNLFINFIGNLLNTESTLSSATTTNLGSAASNIIDITGTTTITAFGSSASTGNPLYFLRFTGILTLTHNGTSLILPGAANITTASGDTAVAQFLGGGNWKVLSYNPVSGTALIPSFPASAPITASLSGSVALNDTSAYFDGPSVAQGSTGTWFASGTVTMRDSVTGSAVFCVKLWDGTTVIASAQTTSQDTNQTIQVSLSGYLPSPAGNLRISVRDITATTGLIDFNASGLGKDATISAFRVR